MSAAVRILAYLALLLILQSVATGAAAVSTGEIAIGGGHP